MLFRQSSLTRSEEETDGRERRAEGGGKLCLCPGHNNCQSTMKIAGRKIICIDFLHHNHRSAAPKKEVEEAVRKEGCSAPRPDFD